MPIHSRPCVFDPATNKVVDFLRRDESEVEALIRLAPHGFDLMVLPLGEAWRRHEAAAGSAAGFSRRHVGRLAVLDVRRTCRG